MNMMKLLPLLIGMAMLFLPATQVQTAEAQASTDRLQEIPAMVRTVVGTIDELFGILTNADNLNSALRNAGLALTVGFNGVINAVWEALYMGIIAALASILIPCAGFCVLPIITILLTLLVYGGVACFNGLEAFTRTY